MAGIPLHMQPQPLRSDDYPEGLPMLGEKEQRRVDSANASYKATADLLLLLVGWGVSVFIENLANSLFWKTSWIQKSQTAAKRSRRNSGPLHAWWGA